MLRSYTNQEGNTVQYDYDCFGRLLAKHYLDQNGTHVAAENFTYAGLLLTQKVDREGHRISYKYDGAGRTLRKTIKVESFIIDTIPRTN